jgi:hypothetical protein
MAVKYKDLSKAILEDINSSLIRGLLQASDYLATSIQRETPVITGNLKQSIKPTGKVKLTADGYKTEVSTPVVYAAYVEYGGGKRKTKNGEITISFTPRAMFRNGARNAEEKLTKIINNNLKEWQV